jgi:hypothetical protein
VTALLQGDRRGRLDDPLHKADVPSFYLACHVLCNRALHPAPSGRAATLGTLLIITLRGEL